MGKLEIEFRPRRESDSSSVNGEIERVPVATVERTVKRRCLEEFCTHEAIVASQYCYDHWQHHQQRLKSQIAIKRRAKTEKKHQPRKAAQSTTKRAESPQIASFEPDERVQPVRYTPPQTELEQARQRFPLCPDWDDAEIVAYHKSHPRGWYEREAGA